MKANLFFQLVISAALSMVISKIIYFGFTPNYANYFFSRPAFNGLFDHDVYKYRILSKYLLFAVDDWLAKDMPEKGAEPRILVGTRSGSERFYFAFFYLNTFFLVLTSIMIVLLLNLKKTFAWSVAEGNLLIFLLPVLIGLSEFTVSPYDVSSYFFQLLIIFLVLRFAGRHFWPTVLGVNLLVILSTLNRESSALSVSMASLLLLTRYGFTRKVLIGIGVMALCFLVTYIALRIIIVDPQHARIVNIQAGKLLIDTNLIGLLFWGLFFYLPLAMATSNENKALITVFFLFSLPYILTVLKDGVLWEVRLYIPLFLGALFLCKLDTEGSILQITSLHRQMLARFYPSGKKDVVQ